MSDLFQTLRKLVREEMASQRFAEIGEVQEVFPADPDNYACSVALRSSNLVISSVPLLATRKGMVSVPDVGDMVLVQFVGGDLNHPIIIGSLYNDVDRPPPNAEGEMVIHLPSSADEDSALRVALSENSPMSAKLNIGSRLKLTLQDADPVVDLDVGDGAATLQIESNGTVTLKSQNELKIEAQSNISIAAGGELNLQGAVIKLN